jgi:hypothetical protein
MKPHRGVWSRADWLIVGALCSVAVLLPALVSLAFGSFSIPQNDDWSYRRVAEHFVQTGHVVFTGWVSMTLIGQILWSWPFLRVFGDHGWVFGVSTAVLAVVGVSCAYYVARQVLARSWAVAAVLLVVAGPLFAWSTSTFMTDVPAFAAEMACLALGVAALNRSGWPRWALLGGAIAIGLFGFSIREFALAAPVAVLLCARASDSPRRRYGYLAAGVVALVVCAVVYLLSAHVPGFLHRSFTRPSKVSIVGTAREYYTMAFMLSPAVAFAAWRRLRWRLSWATITAIAVVVLGAAIDRHYGSLFAGNYLDPQGMASTAILGGGRPTLLPRPLWDLLRVVGLVSGGLLAGIAVTVDRHALRRWRSWAWGAPIGVIWVFGAVFATGLAVYGLLNFGLFDRYLWPLIFALGVLLLHYSPPAPRREWPRLVAGIVVALSALLVLVTTALTVNADTYSAARWDAGQIAVSHGVPANAVDAGFEWVGAHASGIVNPSLHPAAPAYEPWYALTEPGFRECAVVSGVPLNYPNLHLVRTSSYELLGFIGSRTLYIYISPAPGC